MTLLSILIMCVFGCSHINNSDRVSENRNVKEHIYDNDEKSYGSNNDWQDEYVTEDYRTDNEHEVDCEYDHSEETEQDEQCAQGDMAYYELLNMLLSYEDRISNARDMDDLERVLRRFKYDYNDMQYRYSDAIFSPYQESILNQKFFGIGYAFVLRAAELGATRDEAERLNRYFDDN